MKNSEYPIALKEGNPLPDPLQCKSKGILAFGGNLTSTRLLEAYQKGIFPWYTHPGPILWWSPDPRFVLFPEALKISSSMKSVIHSKRFTVTSDTAFENVIQACQETPRAGQDDTWITQEMINAYLELHALGYAHSIEVWEENELVGGLYGVSLGKSFFGESMFSWKSNASKFGFISMTLKLKEMGFSMIDCQVHTQHLESFGATHLSRKKFISLLQQSNEIETLKGKWSLFS